MNLAKIETKIQEWNKQKDERLIWAKDFHSLFHKLGIPKADATRDFDLANTNTFHLNEIQTKEVIDFIDNLYSDS